MVITVATVEIQKAFSRLLFNTKRESSLSDMCMWEVRRYSGHSSQRYRKTVANAQRKESEKELNVISTNKSTHAP